MTDEEQRQEVHSHGVDQALVSVRVGRMGEFYVAYATTMERTPNLETTVSGSRSKARAISYALTELATMFDREGA